MSPLLGLLLRLKLVPVGRQDAVRATAQWCQAWPDKEREQAGTPEAGTAAAVTPARGCRAGRHPCGTPGGTEGMEEVRQDWDARVRVT